MNILALDTASYATGYAIYKDEKITDSGTIKLRSKGESDQEKTQSRLGQLFLKVNTLIEKYNITQLVAEDIFKDSDPRKQSAWEVLGACRGVIIASNAHYQLPLIKFINPCIVKREIWGYTYSRKNLTRAEQKERMCRAVERLGYQLKTDRNGNPDNDQADAIGLLATYLKLHNIPVVHPSKK